MSPQQVDPLSWFTGPGVPLVLALAAVAQGMATTAAYWGDWASSVAQAVALPFFLAAGVVTSIEARANRGTFGWAKAAIVLIIGGCGYVVAAVGAYGGDVPVEQWWASTALAVTLAGLAPYSSARQIVAYSLPLIALVAVTGALVFVPEESYWLPRTTIFIAIGPLLVAVVASAVFSYTVVDRTRSLIADAAAMVSTPDDSAHGGASIPTPAMMRRSADVVPFLRAIAESGTISESDRALAGQLARELRADLVTTTNRSWLDSVAAESGLVVNDPTRLADRMNNAQRAALRGLLLAVMGTPVVDRDSLLIELRARPDGSTAVAISLDVDLPEGRRLMLLAPYYLTLGTTVDNLRWDDGRSTLLQFQIPAGNDRG